MNSASNSWAIGISTEAITIQSRDWRLFDSCASEGDAE